MSRLINWFGFNRRERRASLIFIVLILIFFAVKYLMPERKVPVEYYVLAASPEEVNAADEIPITFDPNSSSSQTMIKAGLTARQANNIISYREKGGRFNTPEDIGKMFTIDSADVRRLIPYIIINRSKSATEAEKRSVELNSADRPELEGLPGIGSVLATRIIRYRNLLGGYASPWQLGEVYGIGDSLAGVLEGLVRADTGSIIKIMVNTAGLEELSRHPYIGKENAEAIVRMRAEDIHFDSYSRMLGMPELQFDKPHLLRFYLNFGN